MTELAQLLSSGGNYAIVQLPGRRFPGVVFQGDSLRSLAVRLCRARAAADRFKDEELSAELDDVVQQLNEVMMFYEKVLEERGISLPYDKR